MQLGIKNTKSLQNFCVNMILDAQHDIIKILESIERRHNYPDINRYSAVIKGIMQKLLIDVRAADSNYMQISTHRDLDATSMKNFISTCFFDCKIQDNLPQNCVVPINDLSSFERIVVNLAANVTKHAQSTSKLNLSFEENQFKLRVYSKLSWLKSVKIKLAKLTKRIDVHNYRRPVYIKLLGRTGRGLAITKREVLKLGGVMVFNMQGRKLEVGFNLPAYLVCQYTSCISNNSTKKRCIYFGSDELRHLSITYGLQKYLVTKTELQQLLQRNDPVEKLEIVSDENIDLPPPFVLKLITKRERIAGLALNWLGEVEV